MTTTEALCRALNQGADFADDMVARLVAQQTERAATRDRLQAELHDLQVGHTLHHRNHGVHWTVTRDAFGLTCAANGHTERLGSYDAVQRITQ